MKLFPTPAREILPTPFAREARFMFFKPALMYLKKQSVLRLASLAIGFLFAGCALASPPTPPSGNVLWMHLDESSGSTVFADSSGLNNGSVACVSSSCPTAGLPGEFATSLGF